MEELVEGVFKGIFKLIRVILVEGICELLLYWVGRTFLLAITLGKYPRGQQTEDHEVFIICTGLVVTIGIVVLISSYV